MPSYTGESLKLRRASGDATMTQTRAARQRRRPRRSTPIGANAPTSGAPKADAFSARELYGEDAEKFSRAPVVFIDSAGRRAFGLNDGTVLVETDSRAGRSTPIGANAHKFCRGG